MAMLISLGVSRVPGRETALLMLLKPSLHFPLCSVYLSDLTGSELGENSDDKEITKHQVDAATYQLSNPGQVTSPPSASFPSSGVKLHPDWMLKCHIN